MRNILFITLDQIRAGMVGHPLVRTPALDEICEGGVHFANHYSQAAPCSPGRAALYTGTYQMNNRVVANGTPLDDRFDNVARLARRAGYDPVLFGYTDQGLDPKVADGPNDPRLDFYSGILPGFRPVLWMPEEQTPWLEWLTSLGYDVGESWWDELGKEPERPAEHSHSSFMTNGFLSWLTEQDEPWFAHLSYLRPHSPYAAAGEFAQAYDPDEVDAPIPPTETPHGLHQLMMTLPICAAPEGERAQRALRAQYYGMVSEVDAQLGRVLAALREQAMWDDTVIIVTADHGEQLCDHGLIEKLLFFEESYRVPLIIRDPGQPARHGSRIDAFTENVDILPTIAELVGQEIPAQCDGLPLQSFVVGDDPTWWRTAAHYEWDWRYALIGHTEGTWPRDRTLEQQNLAVIRDATGAYVHFGDGSWLLFDLEADPTWRTTSSDPARALDYAQAMLSWRQEHLDRSMTDMLLTPERLGRWPSTS